jgi:putative transposase
MHLLMSEPKQGTPSTVLQKLKLRVARKLRKGRKPMCAGQMRLPFAETGEPLRAFWQARFYDFNVYSKGKKREKLNYMHANPVIRGLVKHPRDWPWSSWGFTGEGLRGSLRSTWKSEDREQPQDPGSKNEPGAPGWGKERLGVRLLRLVPLRRWLRLKE